MNPSWPGLFVLLSLLGPPRGDGASGPTNRPEPVRSFTGKVQPLATLLERLGVACDADQAAKVVALVADDGQVYSLLKDDGARMLFLDPELHGRPLRLTGRLLPGSRLLQVGQVHSLIDGKPHEVYYWCANCLLRYTEPGACRCCGEETVRYEVPVK